MVTWAPVTGPDKGVVDGLRPSTSDCDRVESLSVQRSCIPICPRRLAATVDVDIVAGKPRIANQAVTAMNIDPLDLRVVSLTLNDVG